jgi:hypothetical protein
MIQIKRCSNIRDDELKPHFFSLFRGLLLKELAHVLPAFADQVFTKFGMFDEEEV